MIPGTSLIAETIIARSIRGLGLLRLAIAVCLIAGGCARAPEPLPPADYKKDIEDQLGITR
jgi:hypothetical protein